MPNHSVRRDNDELFCVKCGKRWDFNDRDVPECEPLTPPFILKEITPLVAIKDLVDAIEGLLPHYGEFLLCDRQKQEAYVRAKAAVTQGKALL